MQPSAGSRGLVGAGSLSVPVRRPREPEFPSEFGRATTDLGVTTRIVVDQFGSEPCRLNGGIFVGHRQDFAELEPRLVIRGSSRVTQDNVDLIGPP